MADADQLGVESVFLLGCPIRHQAGADRPACPRPAVPRRLPEPAATNAVVLPLGTGSRSGRAPCTQVRGAGSNYLPSPACGRGPGVRAGITSSSATTTLTSASRGCCSYDLAGRDYVGAEWRPGVGYGSGGAGYFLAGPAAAIVAERLTHTTGVEDLLVGKSARRRHRVVDRAAAGALRVDGAAAAAGQRPDHGARLLGIVGNRATPRPGLG